AAPRTRSHAHAGLPAGAPPARRVDRSPESRAQVSPQKLEARELALLRMELRGEDVVLLHGRAELDIAVTRAQRAGRGMRRDDVIGVHEVVPLTAGSHLIPSHVWNFQAGIGRKTDHAAGQEAEPATRSLLLAFLEQNLQPQANAEIRLSAANVLANH